MKLASTLGNKQSFSILACIFAFNVFYKTRFFQCFLGVLPYFFKESLTFDLGVEVFEVFFYSGLFFVHFWLEYLYMDFLLELFFSLAFLLLKSTS